MLLKIKNINMFQDLKKKFKNIFTSESISLQSENLFLYKLLVNYFR